MNLQFLAEFAKRHLSEEDFDHARATATQMHRRKLGDDYTATALLHEIAPRGTQVGANDALEKIGRMVTDEVFVAVTRLYRPPSEAFLWPYVSSIVNSNKIAREVLLQSIRLKIARGFDDTEDGKKAERVYLAAVAILEEGGK